MAETSRRRSRPVSGSLRHPTMSLQPRLQVDVRCTVPRVGWGAGFAVLCELRPPSDTCTYYICFALLASLLVLASCWAGHARVSIGVDWAHQRLAIGPGHAHKRTRTCRPKCLSCGKVALRACWSHGHRCLDSFLHATHCTVSPFWRCLFGDTCQQVSIGLGQAHQRLAIGPCPLTPTALADPKRAVPL